MKRLIPPLVSLIILALIYSRLPIGDLWRAIRTADPGFLLLGVFCIVPIVVLAAWRLVLLAPRGDHLGLWESIKIRVASAIFDLTMPSGSGLVGKTWILTRRGHMTASFAGALVLFDKMIDVVTLLAWAAAGLLLSPESRHRYGSLERGIAVGLAVVILMMASETVARGVLGGIERLLPRGRRAGVESVRNAWKEVRDYFWRTPRRLAAVVCLSVVLWFTQVVQIYFFLRALGGSAPVLASLGRNALALLAGFAPFTLGGLGTRDAALIKLYEGYIDPATGAALGLLCMIRIIGPALAGIPFVSDLTHQHKAIVADREAERVASERGRGSAPNSRSG